MPFYLSEYVGTGTRQDPFVPVGAEVPGWSAIDLRADATQPGGNCLLRLPTPFSDSRVRFLADDKLEALTNPQKNFLQNRLGVDLSSPSLLRDIIATLLTNPPNGGWKALVPGRLRWEVWLGELIWEAPRISGGAVDDFERPNESPVASPWVKSSGSDFNLVSGGLVNTASGDTAYYYLGSATSADQFAQITNDAGANSDCGALCRVGSSGALSGYMASSYEALPGRLLAKFVGGSYTTIASEGATWAGSSTAVFRVEAEGSSIRYLYNGSLFLGPTTDTSLAGAGNGAGIFIFETGVTITSWAGGDLNPPVIPNLIRAQPLLLPLQFMVAFPKGVPVFPQQVNDPPNPSGPTVTDVQFEVALTLVPEAVTRTVDRKTVVALPMSVSMIRLAIDRVFSIALALTPSVTRTISKNFSLALTLVPSVSFWRLLQRNISVTLNLVPSVSRFVGRNVAVPLTLAPSVVRSVARNVTVALTLAPSLTRTVSRAITAALTLVPSVRLTSISRLLSVPLTLAPTVTRRISRNVTVPLTMTVTMTRFIPRAIAVALNFAVSVTTTFVPAGTVASARLRWDQAKGWLHRTTHRRIDP